MSNSFAIGLRERIGSPTGEVAHLMSKLIDVGSAFFKKHHPQVGARPGTLVIADDAMPPKIRMISYDPEEVIEREISGAEELSAAFDPIGYRRSRSGRCLHA